MCAGAELAGCWASREAPASESFGFSREKSANFLPLGLNLDIEIQAPGWRRRLGSYLLHRGPLDFHFDDISAPQHLLCLVPEAHSSPSSFLQRVSIPLWQRGCGISDLEVIALGPASRGACASSPFQLPSAYCLPPPSTLFW